MTRFLRLKPSFMSCASSEKTLLPEPTTQMGSTGFPASLTSSWVALPLLMGPPAIGAFLFSFSNRPFSLQL